MKPIFDGKIGSLKKIANNLPVGTPVVLKRNNGWGSALEKAIGKILQIRGFERYDEGVKYLIDFNNRYYWVPPEDFDFDVMEAMLFFKDQIINSKKMDIANI